MKKRMRGLSVFLIAVMVLTLLAGCGKKEIDPEAAVDAYLRAELKGDFDDYAKLMNVDVEELEEEYNESISELTDMLEEADMFGSEFSDEFTEKVKQMMALAKFEVTGSSKDEDGNYTVDVTTYPSDVYALYFENVMDAAQDAAYDADGDYSEMFLNALDDAIADQSYGEASEFQMYITYNEDKDKYHIEEADGVELFEAFFETEDVLGQFFEASGTVYDNPYFNWGPDEWNAASDDEKTQCCLAIVQEIYGFTDEEMATVDLSDATIQQAVEQMKSGIDLSFSSGMNITIGDYVEIINAQMDIG